MKANASVFSLVLGLGCLTGAEAIPGAEQRGTARDELAKAFANPPAESRPWAYWWWLNGAASVEGITRDFEEMRKAGIGGALLFDAGEAEPDAPRGPKFMSDEWRALFKHALHEAERCGVVLTVNLCSGWNAGGPWVTPEHAAKKLVAAQTAVKGPGHVSVALPQAPVEQGFYRDIAVLAVPMPCNLTASSQYQHYDPALAQDGDDQSRWISNGDKPGMGPTPAKPEFLQFDLAEPRAAAGLFLKPYPDCGPKDVEVQCSDDGNSFKPLVRVAFQPREEKTITFDETSAKHFRIVFLSAYPFRDDASWNVQVAEIALLSKKQVADGKRPAGAGWRHDQVVDLTKWTDPAGVLSWDVPQGDWQVLRIGCTLHGKQTSCVGSGPGGLEIDTMSAAAMDAHFAATGAKLLDDAGPLAGKTLQYFHIDSWELGQPTWTPRMLEEFQRRRGYDPLPWLPAVLGRTIDDAAATRRFLQDYRRTAADLVAQNYYGRLRELTVRGGLRGIHPESGGPFFEHWIDALQCEGVNDVPMGEFWKRNSEPDGTVMWPDNPTVKQAACAAHIHGKPVCQAEAFTSFGDDWADDPWSMKDIGDAAFCEGLTRNVLCFWIHQSRPEAKPGFQWVHVGTHFDCNLTWWPMASGWLTYLARCQHMLREGVFVADFARLQSEGIPAFLAPRPTQRPAGYDYDVLNAEVLLGKAAARDGRLILPSGMSYRYLVLPDQTDAILSPAVLKKINELAGSGVSVIGPGNLTGSVAGLRAGTPDAIAPADALMPDVEFGEAPAGAKFDWIHRRDGATDIYFVSNQKAISANVRVAFRVAGRTPELWDAVTGEIRDLAEFKVKADGRTEVPMQFAPRQSFFVVFTNKSREGGGAEGRKNFPGLAPVVEIGGPWSVQFDPKWFYPDAGSGGKVRFDQLGDWTRRPEEGIRHYSGIATYRTSFDCQAAAKSRRLLLDLGSVRNVARVRLNGREAGIVWTAPWQVDVSNLLKPGSNDLEVEVANLWPNRLIGDATLPKEKRLTVTNVHTYDTISGNTWGCRNCEDRKKTGKPAELLPSGLLGPVRLMAAE